MAHVYPHPGSYSPSVRSHAGPAAVSVGAACAAPLRVRPSGRRSGGFILALLLAVFMFAAPARAQDVTGTITATLGGEERTWSTLGRETDEGYMATASWSVLMGDFVQISVQGHIGERFGIEEALAIELTSFQGFPQDCPCTLSEAEVMYWSTSSMMEKVYIGEAAEVTLTRVEPLNDEAYLVEGTFSATMAFQESVMGEPDPEETLEVEGTFVVERMPKFEME